MIIHGRATILGIKEGAAYMPATQWRKEIDCQLDISEDFLQYYGASSNTDGRGNANINKRKSWGLKATSFLDSDQFEVIFDSMEEGSLLKVEFQGLYEQSHVTHSIKVNGDMLATSMSFSSEGNSLVRCSVSLKGDGKPTISNL